MVYSIDMGYSIDTLTLTSIIKMAATPLIQIYESFPTLKVFLLSIGFLILNIVQAIINHPPFMKQSVKFVATVMGHQFPCFLFRQRSALGSYDLNNYLKGCLRSEPIVRYDCII